VDEPFSNKGSNATYFVKPAAVKSTANLWVMAYEASRPSATAIIPGTGNGYFTSAPVGTTIDKTPACSVPGKIPWFNVTAAEATQTCTAAGGHLCTTAEWQGACTTPTPCKWGYAPRTAAACASTFVAASKFCNLGPSFDFDPVAAGDQDGLLVTGSPALKQCWADWSALNGNPATANQIFDITGNLRELTVNGAAYSVMGGAFNTASENGAACGFSFYSVPATFQLFDLGYRCCYNADPTL